MLTQAASDEQALFARISRRLLPFLFFLYVISFLDRVNVGYAGKQMEQDLGSAGLGEEAFGVGTGIFFFGYFLFEIPSNLILQRVGARRWIARIMFSWGVIATAMMFVRGRYSFYALRFVLGLAEAGFFPGMILYLTYWYPAAYRARAVAMFMTATAVSGVLGSLISAPILHALDEVAHLHGWQWLFLLQGLPAVALGFVVLWLLPDGPGDAKWLSEEERALLARELAREHHTAGHRASDLVSALTHPRIWLLTGVYFCLAMGMYCVGFWLPQLIGAVRPNRPNWQNVLFSGIPYLVAAVSMVIIGNHSDKTGERRWHTALSLLVAATGALASAIWHQPLVALIAFSLVALGIWGALGPFWSMPPAFLAGTGAAGGIALINSIGNLGGFLGPYIFGAIKERTHAFTLAYWVLAGCLVAGAVAALLVKTRRPVVESLA